MMYTIWKEFTLSGMHYLPLLPDGHKCKRPHGHNWTVIFELQAFELDQYGFVVDYGDLADIKEWIDEKLDHRDLNEVLEGSLNPTTAEHLAEVFYRQFKDQYPQLIAVTVCETEKTGARYEFNRHIR